MRQSFFLLILLCPFFGKGQNLPIKGCNDSICDAKKLNELLSGTENALYEFYGFRYNDSIYLEVKASGDSVIFKNSHSWINEDALSYYSKILETEIDYQRLNMEAHYKVIHVQKLDPKARKVSDVQEASLPVPILASNFNQKGQKAAYLYFYDNYLVNLLGELEFPDMMEVELIMKGGKLAAINFIDPPLDERISINFAKKVKAIEKSHFEESSFSGAGNYKIYFNHGAYYAMDESERDEYIYRHFDYYIDQELWLPLKQIYTGGNYKPGEIVDIDTSIGPMRFKLFNYMEAKLAEGKIPQRWWRAIPTQEQLDEQKREEEKTESYGEVGKVPVFAGCNPKRSNRRLKKCFQNSILEFISENYEYPEQARQRAIQGRMYINFVIEKDGQIKQIEVVRGSHYLLDLEGIRVVSEIPDCTQPALINDEPVRMSFTMPINARLK